MEETLFIIKIIKKNKDLIDYKIIFEKSDSVKKTAAINCHVGELSNKCYSAYIHVM